MVMIVVDVMVVVDVVVVVVGCCITIINKHVHVDVSHHVMYLSTCSYVM